MQIAVIGFLKHFFKILDDGLVERSEYLEVPIRVEYDLTDKARRLQPILVVLICWALTDDETE